MEQAIDPAGLVTLIVADLAVPQILDDWSCWVD